MEILILFGSALWLGILTSISPCPLATNIAAVSYLAKDITHPATVFISGLAYTIGRMAAYTLIGWLIIHSLLGVPQVAQFLQKYMTIALGPFLIITGLLLLEVITVKLPGITVSQKHQAKLARSGAPGALVLGFTFALAFCPVSAALFFGSLIPGALKSKTGMLLPVIYGIGTGLPVLALALAIALGATSMSYWFHKIAKLEFYTRRTTGGIFILVGLYYTGTYIIRLF